MATAPGPSQHPVGAFVMRVINRPFLLAAITAVNLVACGLLYAVLEHKGPIEGTWWAIVTGFTVGYGDQYPTTTPGRGVGAYLIVSMFILALCLGAQITAKLVVDRDAFTHEEQEQIKTLLRRIEHRLDNDPTNDPTTPWPSEPGDDRPVSDVADESGGPAPKG